jgi:hypothetical protein
MYDMNSREIEIMIDNFNLDAFIFLPFDGSGLLREFIFIHCLLVDI